MRRLVILGIAVLAVAAFLFLWDLPKERERLAQEEEQRTIFFFSVDDVDTLRIARQTLPVELVRGPDGWSITQPIVEAVSNELVERQLRALTELDRFKDVGEPANAVHAADFGLSPPRAVVEIVLRDSETVAVAIGDQNPGGSATYVQEVGEASISLADPKFTNWANFSHQALRDHDLFPDDESSYATLTVKATGVEYQAFRDERGLWYLEDGRRLKHNMLKNFVYDLATARAREYVADNIDERSWAAYGLHEPLTDIVFETDDGVRHRLRIGNEDKDDLVFARKDEESSVFLMIQNTLEMSETPVEQLLDDNPFDRNFDQLQRVEVVWEDGQRGVLERHDDRFRTVPWPDDVRQQDELRTPVRNVIYGISRTPRISEMILAAGQTPVDVLDEIPVRVQMTWPEEQVTFSLGLRRGEDGHWIAIEGEASLHMVPRDLYFRLRAFLDAVTDLDS